MLPRNFHLRNLIWLAVACLMLVAAGCPRQDSQPAKPPAAEPLSGVTFRLLVADDPALAKAAGRLRGQWHAQTGSDFTVVDTTEQDLAAAKSLDADGVIVSTAMIGALAARGLIAAVPEQPPHAEPADNANAGDKGDGETGDGGSQWGGIFELLQLHKATWGKQLMAVPMGSPVLVCYYRADLLEKLHRQPPQTWEEYRALAELLEAQKPAAGGPWHGAVEPLGPGWAGLTLLARAAPYAKHRDNYSALFDIETMEPLVAGPPFVRALEELAASAKQGPNENLQYDPTAVRDEFWRGHCGLALTWPTAAGKTRPGGSSAAADQEPRDICVGLAELPGAPEAYNVGTKAWEPLAEGVNPHVPLLGIAGRMGAVAAGGKHPEAVWQLLGWLAGPKWSPQVCAASPATTLFRRSHLKSPQQWTERAMSPAAAAQYAVLTEKTLGRTDYLFALRLPGRAEYLAALDDAVRSAVRGEVKPAAALEKAAARWREITRRLGLDLQRAAYRQGLGI